MGEFAELHHLEDLSERMERLLLNGDGSDITFVVEEERVPAHRLVLAASCDYFRALLLGGLRESHEMDVVVRDAAPEAFKLLLKYIYSGVLELEDVDQYSVVELLALSHKYDLKDLQDSMCQFLETNLSAENACVTYEGARVLCLKHLSGVCLRCIDDNAGVILHTDGFLSLSAESLREIISRDSFCVGEIKIFEAVMRWRNKQPDDKNVFRVTEMIRLSLIDTPDLLKTVRDSNMIPADRLLDDVAWKVENKNKDANHRGFLILEKNVANLAHGAKVLTGKSIDVLIYDEDDEDKDHDDDDNNYDYDDDEDDDDDGTEFACHDISDQQGITVDLGAPFIINHIEFVLRDGGPPSSSYYVEVSMSDNDWHQVIDHSEHCCRSLQKLFFEPRVCRYIRVVGTRSATEGVFYLRKFRTMYTEKQMKLIEAICVPEHNVATKKRGAHVVQGFGSPEAVDDPEEMINKDFMDYGFDFGYTQHRIGDTGIIVQLAQPYIIDSIRMLLWDEDAREYSYYIETSVDMKEWNLVVDHTAERCQSWQILPFEAQPVVFIRICGTSCTFDDLFRIVHFECPAQENLSFK